MMERQKTLRWRIRAFTWLFITGLIISGATALPLEQEVDWLAEITGAGSRVETEPGNAPAWSTWLVKVRSALREVRTEHPFLFYGTDWLAFGHFVIALAFVGALRDPVRNRWLFDFGLMACVLVIPWALMLGGLRGIPWWWRLIDCLFGVIGAVPLWLCRRWSREMETGVKPSV